MSVAVEAMPLESLVELVNDWGTAPRLEAGEQDRPYPPAERLAGRLGVPRSAEPPDAGGLTAVADRLHPVFATGDAAARAALVDELLAEAAVRPAARAEGARTHGGWHVADARRAVLAAAAVALWRELAEHPPGRLGTCAGRRCADVYVDLSPGGRRRYCSITCQNRARVAAFRSRRAGSR